MYFFDWYLIWFCCGILGVGLTTYVDSRHGVSDGHLFEYLVVAAITGLLSLGMGLYATYWEVTSWYKEKYK